MPRRVLRNVLDALRHNVRYRLLALVLFPVVLLAPAVVGVAIAWSKHFSYQQLLIKVNTDLSVLNDVFLRTQQGYLDELGRLAGAHRFRIDLERADADSLRQQLSVLRDTQGFAFLHLTDLSGHVLFPGEVSTTPETPLRRRARAGLPAVGVEVLPLEVFAAEDPSLADQVRLALVETRRAGPTTRKVEDRGMVIRAIYPVLGLNGTVVALLDGAVLLNRNFKFVDDIRALVYGPGSLPPDSLGTVTVFLDDVRISTNVPIRPGERALGTRVSQEVREQVLVRGEKWLGRAFVVNDWYISGYEPIVDVNGRRVGMLYAGFLESPLNAAWRRALEFFLLLFIAVVALSAALAVRGARSIFKPLEAMAAVVRATQAGEDRRIGPIDARDELGELARQFDTMLDLLQDRNHQLEEAAEQLEAKVEARTEELSRRNAELERTVRLLNETRRQLVLAEKLAALGELTAGVAHEINNPTAVILGHLDLLVAELGEAIEPYRGEVELIVEQVYRIRSIINNLLQYARHTAEPGQLQVVEVNRLVEETLDLAQPTLRTTGAQVQLQLQATRSIRINRHELQQVLVNLIVNAAHAVERGGRVTVRSEDWERGVRLAVVDDGVGIPEQNLHRVFDPFFTTKADGTGLGLSISYGIVRRYGGTITVDSEPGRGTVFEVLLHERPLIHQGEGVVVGVG